MFQSIHNIWFYKNVSTSIIGKGKKKITRVYRWACAVFLIFMLSTSKYTTCQENLAERETMNRFNVGFFFS